MCRLSVSCWPTNSRTSGSCLYLVAIPLQCSKMDAPIDITKIPAQSTDIEKGKVEGEKSTNLSSRFVQLDRTHTKSGMGRLRCTLGLGERCLLIYRAYLTNHDPGNAVVPCASLVHSQPHRLRPFGIQVRKRGFRKACSRGLRVPSRFL